MQRLHPFTESGFAEVPRHVVERDRVGQVGVAPHHVLHGSLVGWQVRGQRLARVVIAGEAHHDYNRGDDGGRRGDAHLGEAGPSVPDPDWFQLADHTGAPVLVGDHRCCVLVEAFAQQLLQVVTHDTSSACAGCAANAALRLAKARARWLFTVPVEHPIASAIWASERSS